MTVLFGLFCFAMVLVLVTVLGHGLWLLAAMILAPLMRGPVHAEERRSRRRPPIRCIDCGERFSTLENDVCPSCGLNPDSKAAEELRDLEAAVRSVQRLKEQGQVPPDVCEKVYQGLETRVQSLVKRQRGARAIPALPAISPVLAQLEAWFGADLGVALTIEQKKQTLALARTLTETDLRQLSARTLAGLARLQTSLGRLSRAAQLYQILFACHPLAPVSLEARVDMLRIACKLEDWPRAEECLRELRIVPGFFEQHPELEALVRQVQERTTAWPRPAPAVQAETAPLPNAPPRFAEPAASVQQERPETVPAVVSLAAPAVPAVPAAPRRTFAEWIGVFMEESNILWGELIGGTLIVGCSIALVISLWQTLEQIPFFPFLIFAAITSALFGGGFYTLHHWKLESTSRGLLLIATLLAPLNFLVLAGLPREVQAGWVEYLTEIVTLILFAWFLQRSAHILVQTPLGLSVPSAWLISAAMIVSAIALLCAPRWLASERWSIDACYPLSLLPVLAQLGALGAILIPLRKLEAWSIARLAALLIALGSVTFACGVTLAFLLYAAEDLPPVLPHLAPALTLLGVPILLTGIMLQQKLSSGPPLTDGAEKNGLWRTLGTGLALLGLFVMFGGFAVSVEQPVLRWLSGVLNVGTLLATAWVLRVPVLHIPVQVYLAVLIVVGWNFDVNALVDHPYAALRLSGLLVLQALLAEGLIRFRRPLEARYYAIGSGVSTVLALLLILRFAPAEPGITAIVLAAAALTWLGANLRWRYAEITYACALALAGAIFLTFRQYYPAELLPQQLLWSLLTHATLCLLAAVLLRFTPTLDERAWLSDFFRIPLQFASLFATFCVAAVLIVEQFQFGLSWTISSAACVWLAGLWLVLAALEGWAPLFGGFQLALGFAWFFGASAWLRQLGWDWLEAYSLHVYALGIAVLSLTWELTRIAARSQPRVLALLSPPFVPLDRLISGGLVLGQYVLMACLVLWGVARELSATPDAWRIFPAAWYDNAFSISAWLLPLLLAGVMAAWIREHDFEVPLAGMTLLLLTLPLLVAGTWFQEDLAVASALRWGLVLCYGVCSLQLWLRQRLASERAERVPALALRLLLTSAAVVPILWISADIVVKKLTHVPIPGPLAGIFSTMGGPVSLLVPLVLVSAILAGHGICERLAHYMLAAGLLANLSAIGAYFLILQRLQINPDQAWVVVDALLLAAGLVCAWSILWERLGNWLDYGEEPPWLANVLLPIYMCLGGFLYLLALLPALFWIMFGHNEQGRLWTEAAGSVWSWLVFGLAVVSSCLVYRHRSGKLSLNLFGTLSLVAVGVSACTVELFARDQGYIALMFGSGVYACAWVWINIFLEPEASLGWLQVSRARTEAALYATLASGLAIFLGCATLFNGERTLWSAEAIALAAAAFALLAYQRKTEGWASLASLVMVLASSILALHYLNQADPNLWLRVLQIGVAVLGGMSLLRLGLHRLITLADHEWSRLHQLPLQIAAGMLANLMLLLVALGALVLDPDQPGPWLRLQAHAAGWLALLTNGTAAIWYVSRVHARSVVHAVAVSGLLLGILLAGTADAWPGGPWIAHHVLTLSWTLLGLALLIVSWASHAQALLGPQLWPAERRTNWTDGLRRCFPESSARCWVTLCGMFVVVLTLRAAWIDPATPYWSISNTFAVSVLLGALAVWSRAPIYVFGSGLMFNVIGLLIYFAWSAHRLNVRGPLIANDEWLSYFVLAQILSFGCAAIVWSLIERALARKNILLSQGSSLPFTQVALLAGIHLLAIGVGLANGLHLSGEPVRIGTALAWAALGVLIVAALADLWRPQLNRFTRFQLYTCGLLALGLALHGLKLAVPDWYWTATLLLAGYVLFLVVLTRFVEKSVANASGSDEITWFWQVQLGSIGLVLALSLWITLSFATWQQRLGGALASTLVTLAAFLLVERRTLLPRLRSESLVLTLGLVIALETCWALLDPHLPVIWLQRNAVLLTILAAATLLYRFVLPRYWPGSVWATASRSLSAILLPLSLMLLVLLLGQDFLSYDARAGVKVTPLRPELALCSGLAMLALTGLLLYAALTKETDPYGIENDGRAFYVYLAEAVAAALVAHGRLNVPDFPAVLGQFWYLSLLVLAFAGVGLSEIFARKNLPVLATPLKRTAMVLVFVPVLAFRLGPLSHLFEELGERITGLQPFLNRLRDLHNPVMEAVCWLLLGVFFSWLAQLRRSANYGIVAALAVNFGVWVLLGHQDATTFLQRPQLWLIPLGLIILVAEHVNRDRLGFWPSLSVRYAGLVCIYLSSTIEMFKDGLGSSVIFPIVLALLAVIGMMLGILLRVRAFLLAGFMALLIVIFAQIWHAAVDRAHTWVWWACGIILGIAILSLFALFEKHRNEVLKMLDSMKRWD